MLHVTAIGIHSPVIYLTNLAFQSSIAEDPNAVCSTTLFSIATP